MLVQNPTLNQPTTDINDNGYTRIRYLPSRFVPYMDADGNKPEILIRRLKLGEVDYMFANQGHSGDIMRYLAERNVVKGINLGELTVDDWAFVELTLTAMTFPQTKFNIDGGKCPKCGDEITYVELELPQGGTRRIEKRGVLKSVVVPSQVAFQELDAEVVPPVQIEIGGQLVTVDFFRLRHFIEMEKQGLLAATADSDAAERVRNELLTGLKYDDLEVGDNILINYAVGVMAHPVLTEFPVTCGACSHEGTVSTTWEVTAFVPFRTDAGHPRDRVHFGSPTKPVDSGIKKPRLSSRPVAL